MYKMSLIIPVYNASKWLGRLFTSLENQTVFTEIEMIFIDDGSKDSSKEMLDYFSLKYENVIVMHIENSGVSVARNHGLDLATGELISFVDSDDYLDIDYCEKLIINCENENVDLVCTGFIAEYTNKNVIKQPDEFKLEKERILDLFFTGLIDSNTPTKVFKRNIICDLRFSPNYAIAEDKLFVFTYMLRIKSVLLVPYHGYHYVMNDSSATKTEFNIKRFDSLKVSKEITLIVRRDYPAYIDQALSMDIDVKCRVMCDMYPLKDKYRDYYNDLSREIKSYSILHKLKNSSNKHFITFMIARINPRIYNFLRNDMHLQYKS